MLINMQKLTSSNLVLWTTFMTRVKTHVSKFQAENSCQVQGFNVLRCCGYKHDFLLSKLNRPYVFAYYLSE
jgi:hypothetical protein